MSMNELTLEQQATNFETMKHIRQVGIFLHQFAIELLNRADKHDQSKLSTPEVEAFTEYTPKLANTTYGSEEYKGYLQNIKTALDHHYAKNSHHPEHYKNGINDMTLVDLLEMFCDWKAASMRHHDGNILKSIEKNASRFAIDNQLVRIMENTAKFFDGE